MAKSKSYSRNHLSLIQQKTAICLKYGKMIKSATLNKVSCQIVLEITPSEFSRTYKVKIEIIKDKKPNVYILEPNIKNENKDRLPPHMYSLERGQICLNLPSELLLSNYFDVIVPWISEWLIFYEIWKITGKWHGHGHEFTKKEKKLDD